MADRSVPRLGEWDKIPKQEGMSGEEMDRLNQLFAGHKDEIRQIAGTVGYWPGKWEGQLVLVIITISAEVEIPESIEGIPTFQVIGSFEPANREVNLFN